MLQLLRDKRAMHMTGEVGQLRDFESLALLGVWRLLSLFSLKWYLNRFLNDLPVSFL